MNMFSAAAESSVGNSKQYSLILPFIGNYRSLFHPFL